MENLWKIAISTDAVISPKAIFEEQSKYLSQMTSNIIYLDVSTYYKDNLSGLGKIKPDNKLDSTINYQVNVKSVMLEKYAFCILTYEHDIPIYPVKVRLNPDIYNEITSWQYLNENIVVDNQDDFVELVGKILSTPKMGMVINSMLSLSK